MNTLEPSGEIDALVAVSSGTSCLVAYNGRSIQMGSVTIATRQGLETFNLRRILAAVTTDGPPAFAPSD